MADYVNNGQEKQPTAFIQNAKKPKLKNRILGFLFSDKLDSMGTYILGGYLKPGLRSLMYSVGVAAVGFLTGQVPQQPMNGQWNGYPTVRPQTPYNMMSAQAYQAPPQQPAGYNQSLSVNDVRFVSEQYATNTLNELARCIAQYRRATLRDFYSSAGITCDETNWTQSTNGWYTLGNARVVATPDGFWAIVDLPPVQSLR